MQSHYRDYEVEDDEGNFAYSNRSEHSNFNGNQSRNQNSYFQGTYPSGEPFVRTQEGVYDIAGRLRVPMRFFDRRCIICDSTSCIHPHRWFTREGFVHMIGLSGLVRERSIPELLAVAEEEYGRLGWEWNKCEVCQMSTVSRTDREGAGECRLPHRWYTWEGYVWHLIGELGGESNDNELRARQEARKEWSVNGGVGEMSDYEKAARERQERERGRDYSAGNARDYDGRERRTSPPAGWTRSSTGEYERSSDWDRYAYD